MLLLSRWEVIPEGHAASTVFIADTQLFVARFHPARTLPLLVFPYYLWLAGALEWNLSNVILEDVWHSKLSGFFCYHYFGGVCGILG